MAMFRTRGICKPMKFLIDSGIWLFIQQVLFLLTSLQRFCFPLLVYQNLLPMIVYRLPSMQLVDRLWFGHIIWVMLYWWLADWLADFQVTSSRLMGLRLALNRKQIWWTYEIFSAFAECNEVLSRFYGCHRENQYAKWTRYFERYFK